MIVYVETNFLLEVAYEQEAAGSCRQLLELAREKRIALSIPAFATAEARLVWARRASERRIFHEQLQRQIRELSRSEPFQGVEDSSQELLSALAAGGEVARARLEKVIAEVAGVGIVLPLDSATLGNAYKDETELEFRPADAIIYASITRHASDDPRSLKVFLNRNSKDFATPTVYAALTKLNCKVIASFEDGVQYVLNALAEEG